MSGERFRIKDEDVAAKVIEEEAIIINLSTGVYYSMGSVGARIWTLLEAGHDVGQVVEAIADAYEVPSGRCREDVERLVGQLVEESLLQPADGSAAEPAPGVVRDGRPEQPYEAPELQIYRDMGDLLAIDPPVPGLEPIPWDDPDPDRM